MRLGAQPRLSHWWKFCKTSYSKLRENEEKTVIQTYDNEKCMEIKTPKPDSYAFVKLNVGTSYTQPLNLIFRSILNYNASYCVQKAYVYLKLTGTKLHVRGIRWTFNVRLNKAHDSTNQHNLASYSIHSGTGEYKL